VGAQYRREPFTTAQIVQKSKEKVPAEEIIHKIRLSHTVYSPTSLDMKRLLDEGVDPKVVDGSRSAIPASSTVQAEVPLRGYSSFCPPHPGLQLSWQRSSYASHKTAGSCR
jgi:hypothetical protein